MNRLARRPDSSRKIMAPAMSARAPTNRLGDEADGPAVAALFDEAVGWLVERDQTGQ